MTERVRTLIVEDEARSRERLRELLAAVPWIDVVGDVAGGRAACSAIDTLRPDLVFLDIELPEMSGLEVLRSVTYQPAVIFTTAYDRYAVSAFELEALDYLLKPFGAERLEKALERARRIFFDHDPDSGDIHESENTTGDRLARALQSSSDEPLARFFVRDRGHLVPVAVQDIVRLEADDDYVRVFTRERSYLVCLSLNDFERRLDPQRFLRIHRTHVVNLDVVAHLTPLDGGRLQVELQDGTRIVASRARSRLLRELTL